VPSTVVHVAFAGLIGVALLGEEFDTRAILIVMAVTALVDLDTFIGLYAPGTHRAALHNVWVAAVPAAAIFWDTRVRERSTLRARWGAHGYHLAWVTVVAVLVGHVLFDAFFNGVNLFWPVYDRFFDLSGELLISDQRGIVQTFVEFETTEGTTTVADSTAQGTTENTHYSTGVDPTRDEPPEDVERVFPIAGSGERFVLTVAGFLAVGYRIVEDQRSNQ
jgi:hypothetical protein